MWINHDKRFVFVDVPKCGTHTMRELLRRVPGRTTETGLRPVNEIPPGCQDWFTFTTVRHPYSRAVSLWRSTINDFYQFQDLAGGEDFPSYARWLGLLEARNPLLTPMHKWLDGIRRDVTLHLETLEADLDLLPWWTGGPIPTLNASTHKPAPDQCKVPWYEHITPDLVPHLNAWCGPDLEMFGYDWPL